MSNVIAIAVIVIFVFAVPMTLIYVSFRLNQKNKLVQKLAIRLAPITNIELEAQRIMKEADEELDLVRKKNREEEIALLQIQKQLTSSKGTLEQIQAELESQKDQLELSLDGYNEPVFELEDTAAYVIAIKSLRERQKELIRAKKAVICDTNWEVGGSRAEGKKMANKAIRLTLRAFNNEADLLIGKATWKNSERTKERIRKVAALLDDLNQSLNVHISQSFIDLKTKEVDLVYQQQIKQQEDKERMREEKAREREEARAQREIAAEMRRQSKLESEKQAALDEARRRLEVASLEHKAALEKEIAEIECELSEAILQKGRLLSMAEQTRIGHVYIISNKGSFGDGVVKIGMTRRLEPMDRVKELGDASVPFGFDVHAMIFADDAPALEKNLHKRFEEFRVNRVNNRKEFFRVELSEVEKEVSGLVPGTPFHTEVSSFDYINSLRT